MAESAGMYLQRPMRLKILYTFDVGNRRKCLARPFGVFQIRTAFIDPALEVGATNLDTCLRAVLTASPELSAEALPCEDFAIYTIDYSEQGTPQVGYGLLSDAVAKLEAGLVLNEIVTGRVCKNTTRIFETDTIETLEMEFRLAPVSRATRLLARNRSSAETNLQSSTMSNVQIAEWDTAMQECDNYLSDYSYTPDSPALVGHALSAPCGNEFEKAQNKTSRRALNQDTDTISYAAIVPASRDLGSKAQLPEVGVGADRDRSALVSGTATPSDLVGQIERNGEVATETALVESVANNLQVFVSDSIIDELSGALLSRDDEKHVRKRAKITQTDWRGRGSFDKRSSDLRVKASTAASVHMQRPILRNSQSTSSRIEPPPRVPTPIPQCHGGLIASQREFGRRSLLRQASVLDSGIDPASENASNESDAIASSPNDMSPSKNSIVADGTPFDIPSSPPFCASMNLADPCSPILPLLSHSRTFDSGYLSERGTSSSHGVDEYDQGDGSGRHRSSLAEPTVDIRLECPGDMKRLPQKILLNIPPGRQRLSRPGSDFEVRRMSTGAPPNTNMRDRSVILPESSLLLPKGFEQRRDSGVSESRAETPNISYQTRDCSPAPSDADATRSTGPRRSGSGATRRKVIQDRLERSIASGSMPHFCHHCGAIETPTWRKLYVKSVEGKPTPLDYSEGEGETIGIELFEGNDGEINRFIIRKSMKKTKDCQPGPGFEDVSVCNPCGLWFGKFRSMRPPEKWQKRTTTRKGRKRAMETESFTSADGFEPASEPFFSSAYEQQETSPQARSHGEREFGDLQVISRSASVQPGQDYNRHERDHSRFSKSAMSFSREIRSSPVRFHGSQTSPVDVESVTPQPTRRILFPSPRQNELIKRLDDIDVETTEERHCPIASVTSDSPRNAFQIVSIVLAQQENIDPLARNGKTGLSQSMKEEVDGALHFRTPEKRVASKTEAFLQHATTISFTTPTRSSNQKRNFDSTVVNNNPCETSGGQNNHDFLTSPFSPRYFLRSTPSRKERSPTQQPQVVVTSQAEISPFSRHLAQMLSDAPESAFPTSPQNVLDLSDVPGFTTPTRSIDWAGIDAILSSEFPLVDDDDKHI